MGTKERTILFMHNDGTIVRSVPLDSYIPGYIRETQEILAKEMDCSPGDIRVKITGIRHGRPKKGSSLRIQLIDSDAIRNFFE